MHKTTLYLDQELHQMLQRLAESSGRTQAQIVRDALRAYAVGERKRPRSIGLGRGGADLSQQAEALLVGFGEET